MASAIAMEAGSGNVRACSTAILARYQVFRSALLQACLTTRECVLLGKGRAVGLPHRQFAVEAAAVLAIEGAAPRRN